MSFDKILEHIGGCGRYQILVLILMNVLKTFTGYETLLPVIIAYEQKYQCSENETLEVPGNGSLIYDKCDVFRNETPEIRVPCTEWTFDDSVMKNTIVNQYQLICGREYLNSLTSTLYFVGFMIGCTVYGVFSDRFGRMIGMLTTAAHLFIFSFFAAFAPDVWTFGVLRLFSGIGNGGLMAALFTMSTEVTDAEHRAFFSIMSQNGFTVGGLINAMLGYLVGDHFWIQIILALLILMTIFLPLFVHESPRWLMTTGQLEKADRVIRSIADQNGTCLPHDFCVEDYVDDDKLEFHDEPTLKDNFVQLFRTRSMAWTTSIVWYYWFVISVGYFGSYFTLGKFGKNFFVDIVVNSSAEILSRIAAVYFCKWFGRVLSLTLCGVAGGLTCLINSTLIQMASLNGLLRALSATGQFFFTAGFEVIWSYSGEVFPTVIRTAGVGIGSTWARIGATLAPQAVLLYDLWKPAPLIVMGIFPIIGGLVSLVLPETKDKELPETMANGADFVKSEFGIVKTFKACRHRRPTPVFQEVPME